MRDEITEVHRGLPNVPMQQVASDIARVFLEIAIQHKHAPRELKSYYYVSLKWMARLLEVFVQPHRSREAQRIAGEMKLGDLRQYRWCDQPTRMKDKKRKIFHWEHAVQTSDMAKAILELSDPTVDEITEIVNTTTIVWITKDENSKLKRGSRQDWRKAYSEAKIEILP